VAKETFGVPVLFNLFLSVSRDHLSGTGILGILLASILGILLIWDARDMGETLKQRNQ
jgi:protein-S-isoprenylcysteine O-methyltransferase Ste14